METFLRLFGSLLRLVYHCFDRMVIFGYLPLLSRPEHIVYFFRDVHGVGAITKDVLRQRTDHYNRWVEYHFSLPGDVRAGELRELRDPNAGLEEEWLLPVGSP